MKENYFTDPLITDLAKAVFNSKGKAQVSLVELMNNCSRLAGTLAIEARAATDENIRLKTTSDLLPDQLEDRALGTADVHPP